MSKIKVTKASSVASLQKQFKKATGATLRIYNGIKFADPKSKISDLAKKESSKSDLDIGARKKVKTIEEFFEKNFGIKANVANADDSSLAKDEMTITQAKNC